MGLLQRVILMYVLLNCGIAAQREANHFCRAARSVKTRPHIGILDMSRTDSIHQSLIISLLRVAIRPIYSVFTLGSANDKGLPLSEVLAKRILQPSADDGISALRPVDSSRSGFIACYFYLYMILREERVDSFILHWFVDQLWADVCRTQSPMRKGRYSQSLWFWTVMFGACVVTTVGKTTSDPSSLEAAQMKLARDEYLDKIALVSRLLRTRTWESAKSQLSVFAWEDDFDGEADLRTIWEEAVWAGDDRRGRSRVADSSSDDDDDNDDGKFRSARAFW